MQVEAAIAQAQAQAEKFFCAMSNQLPISLPLREDDRAALAQARAFRFGPQDSLAGWRFGADAGPVVALVHGWGGQSTQFLRMARMLAARGFEAVIIDVGNHGASAPARMGFDRFMHDARALVDHLGAMPFAWVAHSAAALAILSARRTHAIDARAYVTLAAPFVPYVPLNRFRAMGADEAAVAALMPLLARQFEAEWDALEQGLAWQVQPGANLLAVYDADDAMVTASDAERVRKAWPGCDTVQTHGLGHNRLLGAHEVIQGTADFLVRIAAPQLGTTPN